MKAIIFVHPAAFLGPGGTNRLLALAVRHGLELVSSRRGNILLVPRIEAVRHWTERRA